MKNKLLLSIFAFGIISSPCFSIDMGIAPVNPLEKNSNTYQQEMTVPSFDFKKASLSKNAVKNQYLIAMNKYMKSNVRSSYSDFKVLIDSVTPNDYIYMQLTKEMASIGFFNLSELAMSKIQDDNLASLLDEDVKTFYFPASDLTQKDQIYLAEMYSNIMYNDQSREAVAELSKQTSLLVDSDYANYILAFGSEKNGDIKQAQKYINDAINKNPKNINYKRLKSEILAQSSNPKDSAALFKDWRNEDMKTVVFNDELHSSKEYSMYKAAKNEYEKKYHLAHYYYDKGEYNKALGVTQTSISRKKNINRDVYALTAKIYYNTKEYEKAQSYALKALEIDKENAPSLIVLGDIAYRNKNYNEAVKYYKKAQGKTEDYSAELKLANVYLTLNETQKAKDIYSKILKVSSKSYMAYYQMALLEPDRELEYIKKAISINPGFYDAWIDLAKLAINKENFEKALSYLGVVKYINESDCRYYYYLGLVMKGKGMLAEANENFAHSLKLNPDYDLAKKELNL
ncbi:MAG: tetratricopeptide repeat protein [Cyanobacteriota bacterium]|nr:tetratricopeptide repeat protein [Cyanobacteriota bacterium]MDY6358644.1 tetratricopeptide repeat protein [Cyanobacteriota bacterium]MDY6363701.1 tetratricopeptide repeat protein [Cyanobacteriota bacterium]MDY6383578.1 tetratricopeptide repeat protein [Cyanobacteriota bacterium]